VLDDFLPTYDFHEVHSVATDASPAAVMDAIKSLTPLEVPVLVALMAVRSLPAILRRRPPAVRGTLLDGFRKAGFVPLRDAPDEVVYGGVGRFWKPTGDLRRVDPAAFAGFADPGCAKAVFNLRVDPAGERTLLTTETRIATTDEHARRSFACYWGVIHPGSALIRRDWLRAIRRRAERGR
jgi:hypothetical protein